MLIPISAGWTLEGADLPGRLLPQETASPSFSLPGADALEAFADLIGTEPDESPKQAAPAGVPFLLPAAFPEDVTGEVTLSREIDFGSLHGDTAALCFDMLCGQGTLTLTSLQPRFMAPGAPGAQEITLSADFSGAPLTLDVTEALLSHRRFLLSLRFGDERPAGVCGPVCLRTASLAALHSATVLPDPVQNTLTVSADVEAYTQGDYVLCAQLCPAKPPRCGEEASPIHEVNLRLAKEETRSVQLSMAAALEPFTPGTPYAAPGVKIWLYKTVSKSRILCDSETLMVGFPGAAPAYQLPLDRDDLLTPPEELIIRLQALHVQAVRLPAPAPDILYRMLTRAGIAAVHSPNLLSKDMARLRRYPCVSFERPTAALQEEVSPALSAWQLCGLITYPRTADPGLLPEELLADAAGREVTAASEETQAVLAWLRAFSIRLRAEAMRQGKLTGMLCMPSEYRQADAAQAIRTALAPLHLSALPLCGAWWTGSRFSAALTAFIPREILSVDKSIRAEASLEDADGNVIARTEYPCAPWRSGTGLLECTLPDTPCALELVTRIWADDEVLEASSMPVYVGERGPLEAAF